MNKIQSEQWVDSLPNEAVKVAEEINIEIAKVIAERIKKIGELSPSDIHKLTNSVEYLGADFEKITKLIAKYSNKGQSAISKILQKAADANDDFAKVFYSAKGITPVTWRDNPYLKAMAETIAKQTITEFTNLSQTLAYKINGKTMPLRQMYTYAIDKAIYEVQSGTIDYHTAMRKTIKQLSNNMRIVDAKTVIRKSTGEVVLRWPSGYSRRLDSHVRQNLLDGVKQLNQQMLEYHGEKFGADGVELSAHAISAPDHVAVQGRQFSKEQFSRMQNALPFFDVKGIYYTSFKRPIGQWNCRHFAFPIVIGITAPAYTEEQLKAFERNSAKKYELTQQQRVMETKLRKLKNERLVASAAGDEIEARRTQRKINELQAKYRKFSKDNDISYQPKRASVEGYRRISAKENNVKNIHDRAEEIILRSKGTYANELTMSSSNGKITESEIVAINSYISSDSYSINAALRNNYELLEYQKEIIHNLDAALVKLPKYEGIVYRSLDSSMIDMKAFNKRYSIGNIVIENGYTSTSTEVYDETMSIQMIIKSKNGRDLRLYNEIEKEILFRRGTVFVVTKREENTIWLSEI